MKKRGILVILMILVTFFMAYSAEAGWFQGTIKRIYQYPTSIVIEIERSSDLVLVRKVVDPANEKNILAVALTAQANGNNIEVYYSFTLDTFTALGIVP